MGINSGFKGLMLYREIIAVCSQIHTEHINTLCGQNVEFVNVKPLGTYSKHWALNGLNFLRRLVTDWSPGGAGFFFSSVQVGSWEGPPKLISNEQALFPFANKWRCLVVESPAKHACRRSCRTHGARDAKSVGTRRQQNWRCWPQWYYWILKAVSVRMLIDYYNWPNEGQEGRLHAL